MGLISGRSRNGPSGDQPVVVESMNTTEKDSAPAAGPVEPNHENISKSELFQRTRTRLIFACISSFFLFITWIFMILVEVGNTKVGHVLSSIYFLRLDLANIVPASVPNSVLINTIAQTLGLHDYYQFGLWNFCEGYVSQGITDCGPTELLYWFDPVEILLNELLAGATIVLPTEVTTYLHILKVASNVMFGLFLAGACLSFVLMFILPLSVYSRLVAFFISLLAGLNALFITIASVIGTAISVIFTRALQSYKEVNISANIGKKMLAFTWIASAFAVFAWIIQLSLVCCCTSRRDVIKAERESASEGATGGHEDLRRVLFWKHR